MTEELATTDKQDMPLSEIQPTYKTLGLLLKTPTVPMRYKMSDTGQADMFAAALHGRELGIGPMTSINELYLVNGTMSMSAKLMAALIYRAGHIIKLKITATGTKGTALRWHPQSSELVEVGEYEFTNADAKKAGLDKKQTYSEYPKLMQSARCISGLARLFYADVIHGFGYVPEEVGVADVVEPIPDVIEVDYSEEHGAVEQATSILGEELDAEVVS